MSSFTLDAIHQHLENAQMCVRLSKNMRSAQRHYLLNLGLTSLIESLELLRLEVRGEQSAAAPVIDPSDDLDAAETGSSVSSDHERLVVRVGGGSAGGADTDAEDTSPLAPSAASPTLSRAAFQEPLYHSPITTPRPVAAEAPVPPQAPAEETAPRPAAGDNYKTFLTAAGNPSQVFLKLPRNRNMIMLPVDYTGAIPLSRYTEPSGTVFEGTLRRVAERAKFLAGYAADLTSRALPVEQRRAPVNMKKEIFYHTPAGEERPLGAA